MLELLMMAAGVMIGVVSMLFRTWWQGTHYDVIWDARQPNELGRSGVWVESSTGGIIPVSLSKGQRVMVIRTEAKDAVSLTSW